MIELLILFVLEKRDLTTYAVQKHITDKFGIYTKPSLGTIHPAIIRLEKKGCIETSQNMSEGGKKMSLHHLTKNGLKYFKEHFFAEISQNPSILYNQIQVRLATISLLSDEDKTAFFDSVLSKIELYSYDFKNNSALKEDEDADFFQKELAKKTLLELERLKAFIAELKAHVKEKG